jgi:hypothetical protein
MRPFRKMDRNFYVFANSCWEMLLKVIGQPLGTAKRVKKSHWEMPKDYWIAFGQSLEGIGKPLGNAHIPAVSQ